MNLYVCHTGGASGADTYFEAISEKYGIAVCAYSYQTPHHQSKNKRELTFEEYREGLKEVEKANKYLQHRNIQGYKKLLARNWFQVKNAQQIFAVGFLHRYLSKWCVNGGTAWAIEMAKNHRKEIYFYEQNQLQWYVFDHSMDDFAAYFQEVSITNLNFAGIGTRNLNLFGTEAIDQLFKNSFGKVLKKTPF